MRLITLIAGAALAFALAPLASAAAESPAQDPLGSSRWGDMKREFFRDERLVFDERVKVSAPATAEDAMNVPVKVDASALAGVEEVLVFADFNPIVKALSFEPGQARSVLGFRLKLQQSTPVRAAARTTDGVWHVGGTWVNTTGGGCTLAYGTAGFVSCRIAGVGTAPERGQRTPVATHRWRHAAAAAGDPSDGYRTGPGHSGVSHR